MSFNVSEQSSMSFNVSEQSCIKHYRLLSNVSEVEMVLCLALGCKDKSEKSSCKFHRFSKNFKTGIALQEACFVFK